MTKPMPKFVSLTPTVLTSDRVLLNLETTNFATQANVFLDFETKGPTTESTSEASMPVDPETLLRDTPYPNVALTILDENHQEVAQLFIVEHKEAALSMTLHIRQPKPDATYIARADMIHNQQLIQTLTTPFRLIVKADS